ncbi:hypothetical protein HBM99_13775 [Providencia heimbachae]|uniref:hypothetical protein n=1 Tax=Providencia heimbachae TaxID=333962 RepID=UPI001419ED10|nr:hypothetical protein [Providencia heimbachae]NIH21833.1 hypothetical protein [Providencia heimbachae]NIH23409.1 hypothetical protein [Providencia heimbachae]
MMKYYNQYPVTLKHFLHRPCWAAAAGYDFNFIDCMAYTVNAYSEYMKTRDWLFWLDSEIRELPMTLLMLFFMLFIALSTPFLYPFYSIATYINCKRSRKDEITEIVDTNLSVWLRDFERR